MKRKEFFKDKHKKLHQVIRSLGRRLPSLEEERLDDDTVMTLRALSFELTKQIHELQAGRNIFVDNDKDMKEAEHGSKD